ncbi:MAG: ubiquinone/menaquinone biosynthesis methyltransferase [Candidatus Methylomirabilales bacterium]
MEIFRLKEWPENGAERQAYLDPVFATIASKYDFMTRVLSFGQEQRWKRKAVGRIPRDGPLIRMLDLATGTGDFPVHLHGAGLGAQIVALDRNPTMLAFAARKCARHPQIRFIQGDLMHIPFKDHLFDAITMGYGLRYVADILQTLREVFRLLRSGGMFVCLDFGLPKSDFYRRVCSGYLLLSGTLWGLLLHGKRDTYWHIVESLKAYPGQEAVAQWMKGVGFDQIEAEEELGGIAVIISGVRP